MTTWENIKNKIVDAETAKQRIQTWKNDGLKVVFTNGCFDILHRGHVTYLAKAADFGDKLVVALNTDVSVKKQNKGTDRPVNDQHARQTVMASLAAVDLVLLFDETTPLSLILTLQPSVLVKGADYDSAETDEKNPRYIVGAKEVKKYGGKVRTVALEDGYSTTNIIKKLKG